MNDTRVRFVVGALCCWCVLFLVRFVFGAFYVEMNLSVLLVVVMFLLVCSFGMIVKGGW